MKKQLSDWASIAEIISSVAIVSTLAYLAVQSRQTNDMLLGNSRQALISADLAWLTTAIEHPEEAALTVDLPPETFKVNSFLITFFRIREFAWFQYRNGTLDVEILDSYMRPAIPTLRSAAGAAWWGETGPAGFDPEFIEFVNVWMAQATSVPQ